MNLHPSIKTMAGWLDGTLSQRARARFELHIESCERCRRQLDILRQSGEACAPSEEDLEAVSAGVMKKVGRVVSLSKRAEQEDDLSRGETNRAGEEAKGRQADSLSHWNLSAPILGEIAEVEGEVVVRRGAGDEGVEAFPGCAVREGERIEPVDGGRAVVLLDSGRRLTVTDALELTADVAKKHPAAIHRTWAWMTGGGVGRKRRLQIAGIGSLVTAAAAYAFIVVPIYDDYKSRVSEGKTRNIVLHMEMPEGEADPWAVEYNKPGGATAVWGDLVAKTLYLKKTPRSRGGDERAQHTLGYTQPTLTPTPRSTPRPTPKTTPTSPPPATGNTATLYNPLTGTVSEGDVWRVTKGGPPPPTSGHRLGGRNYDGTVDPSKVQDATLYGTLYLGKEMLEGAIPEFVPDNNSAQASGRTRETVVDVYVSDGAVVTKEKMRLTTVDDGTESGDDGLLHMAFAQDLKQFQGGLEAPILSTPPGLNPKGSIEINGIQADPSTAAAAKPTSTPKPEVLNVAFAPGAETTALGLDSSRLGVKNEEQRVKIWDVGTGHEVATLWGDLGQVTGVTFSPDGKRLATASANNTAVLWDVQTGRRLHKIAAGTVSGVTFTADGRQLKTTDKDKTVRTWDAETGALITIVEDQPNSEAYDEIVENDFMAAQFVPLSTFSIDVDTASYSNVRRFINAGQRPPRNAVRVEELINYFHYDYPDPVGDAPFAVNVEIADCPWNDAHRLARIGLKGQEVSLGDRPPSNIVFLLDVSGSMSPANKLPLVKQSLRMLVENLGEDDCVSIVVYAGASGLVLSPTRCGDKRPVFEALDRLKSGGSTNGGSGIMLAYSTAHEHFIEGGVNRVILATDGDFNVGVTDREELIGLIEEEARMGCFLTVLGFGMGNLKDATLEQLADKGNGNYAYIDSIAEAQKALVEELNGTLVTVAKDVKVQVEFNPLEVAGYRLIGYENRMLKAEDFNDDTKDAGEMGAAHRVTALYEIVPAGVEIPAAIYSEPVAEPIVEPAAEEPADERDVDPLRYREFGGPTAEAQNGEMMTVKLRYKEPDGHASKLLTFPVADEGASLNQVSTDYMFVAAVASFGMILRDSHYKGDATLDKVLRLAEQGKGVDLNGYRQQFIDLVNAAKGVMGEK